LYSYDARAILKYTKSKTQIDETGTPPTFLVLLESRDAFKLLFKNESVGFFI
jgi:hypothetical protein